MQELHGHKLRILILGGGCAGYYALWERERRFRRSPGVEITLISKDIVQYGTSRILNLYEHLYRGKLPETNRTTEPAA